MEFTEAYRRTDMQRKIPGHMLMGPLCIWCVTQTRVHAKRPPLLLVVERIPRTFTPRVPDAPCDTEKDASSEGCMRLNSSVHGVPVDEAAWQATHGDRN